MLSEEVADLAQMEQTEEDDLMAKEIGMAAEAGGGRSEHKKPEKDAPKQTTKETRPGITWVLLFLLV